MNATASISTLKCTVPHWRFTARDYHRMAEAGILNEDSRVELIEGMLLEMSPIGNPHAATVNRLTALFIEGLGKRAVVGVQNPIRLSERSEPQPDMAILRPRADFYSKACPFPADMLLLIEVADSTLGYDRDVKMPLYAAAGIPESWIADLNGDRLRVYRDPDPKTGEYRTVLILGRDAEVTPLAFADLHIPMDEILG